MADVEIGDVNTRIEVFDPATNGGHDLARIVDLVIARLSEEQRRHAMRAADDRISDRSWRSDVKPG